MLSAPWSTFWIYVIHFSFSCCVNLPSFLPVEQPGTISCPLRIQSNYTVTWYRNGSDTPITTDNYSRVHQQGNLLWFHPANLEDSGEYHCIYNSSRANKNLMVFENSVGLCFNTEIVYIQRLPLGHNEKLTCPDLYNFRNYENAPLVLQWYKGCHLHLFKDLKFQPFGKHLSINNLTKEDEGTYICKAKHTYMGKEYNISRAINLTAFEQPKRKPLEIIYPNNNSAEVKLGSRFDLVCNVSGDPLDIVFLIWEFNKKRLENIDVKTDIFSGNLITEAKFNISKVKYRDYGKYLCVAWSFGVKQEVAYIMLKHPAKNVQIYLVGGFVSSLFVILAALLTYKYFRVDIALWYRDSCRHLSKGTSDGKIYDAYVLYPYNISGYVYLTDTFVLKLLPEILEKQCGYKLFILGRDDVPGQAVITIVDKVIKLSRRVIIILIPELYCGSMQSSIFEQDIAVYSALIEEETKVILIELEKIKDFKSMPESLRYLKQKHGILTWKGDFTVTTEMATTRFWKHVRYHMPASPNPLSSDFHFLPVTFHSSRLSEG